MRWKPSGRTWSKKRRMNSADDRVISLMREPRALWRAYEVQTRHHGESTHSIGIYRAGFKSKTPVFYLWVQMTGRDILPALKEVSFRNLQMVHAARHRLPVFCHS
jgi:hypothetical protein